MVGMMRLLGLVLVLQGLWVATGMTARAAEGSGSGPGVVEDFRVPSLTGGEVFQLSKVRGQYVALHFLLKTECPVCLRHTRAHLGAGAALEGVRSVFLKPDTDAEIRQWARDLPKDMPLYRDADAALAKRMGVPGGYAFHGQVVHYPALVLIGPDGREVFRYVGTNNTDRVSVERLAAKVRELRGR